MQHSAEIMAAGGAAGVAGSDIGAVECSGQRDRIGRQSGACGEHIGVAPRPCGEAGSVRSGGVFGWANQPIFQLDFVSVGEGGKQLQQEMRVRVCGIDEGIDAMGIAAALARLFSVAAALDQRGFAGPKAGCSRNNSGFDRHEASLRQYGINSAILSEASIGWISVQV